MVSIEEGGGGGRETVSIACYYIFFSFLCLMEFIQLAPLEQSGGRGVGGGGGREEQ